MEFMNSRRWILAIVAAAAVTLLMPATAQKFQEPTKEELQMTSDPLAPDAPAVYLYREDIADNRNHYISRYARLKILTEKGKEWATVEVPYVPGYSAPPMIEARTIHSDGAVVPLQGKAEDLLAFKTNKFHVKVAVFNMPSVEVGSILEYKWTIPLGGGKPTGIAAGGEGEEDFYSSALASSIPEWEVQQDLFVHKEHFYWNPLTDIESNVAGNLVTYIVDGERASYLLFSQRLPAGFTVTESPRQDYTLDIQNVPAFKQLSDAPPEDSLRYRVHFYYTPYTTARDYWESEIKRWSHSLDQYATQSSAIQSAAAQIAASAATPELKARKLYDAVQALDNTEFSREKSDAERKRLHLREQRKAEDVLNQKSGSANDLAGLYLALARAAGLSADGLKVADRRSNLFDQNYLSLYQLDTLLVVLHLDGKDIYLDPGEKLCPFGQLHWAHTLTGGIQQNQKDPIVTPPNSTKDAITAHAADLAVDPTGSATGTVQFVMNGPAALHWRQLNLTSDSDEVKKQLTESLQTLLPNGMNIEIAGMKGLDTSEGFFQVTAKVSGAVGTVTGKRILLPAFLFSTVSQRQFVSEDKRDAPVDMHYAEQVMDEVTYHLPAGYTLEGAPQSAQLPWPDHAALVVKVTSTPNSIDVKHIYARAFVLLDAKEYPALHDYYGKLAASDQQQVVLAASSASGN